MPAKLDQMRSERDRSIEQLRQATKHITKTTKVQKHYGLASNVYDGSTFKGGMFKWYSNSR